MTRQNMVGATLEGALSLANAYCAADNLIDYVNTKAIVLQTELAKAPEVTEQVYESAREFAESVSRGDFYTGLFNAGVAGFVGAAALYNAFRKDKE